MPPVRILHLTSTPRGIGGVERLLLEMVPHYDPALVSVGHCNLFDAAEGNGRFPMALKSTPLPFHEVSGHRWHDLPKVVSQVRRIVRSQRIEVLHLHMVHATVIGGLIAALEPSIRTVVTKHYAYRGVRKPTLRALDRRSTNRADVAVAVSSYIRDDLVANGAGTTRTRVIHNGIDLVAFDRAASSAMEPLKARKDELLIGCVGNLHPIKGHVHLLRAIPRIVREYPASRFIFVGEGPEKDPLKRLAESLGIDRAVTFAGFSANVPSLMRQFDLCVQPSLHESFGLVLLEAMAASVPVVASNVEGIPEIVVEGVTGRLVPVADANAISVAVCSLLENIDRRSEMGRASRDVVQRRFDIRDTVRSYERLYGELTSRD